MPRLPTAALLAKGPGGRETGPPMTSAFDTAFAAAQPTLDAAFGEALTYTSAAAAETAIPAGTFCEHATDRETLTVGQSHARRAVATIPLDLVALPDRGGTIAPTATAEAWTILTRRLVAGGTRWELALSLADPIERTRPDYRTR